MGIVRRLFGDQKKEREINKKLKTAKENETIAAEKKKYARMGLSEDEAEFKARREMKRNKQKQKINKLASGVSGAVNALAMDMDVSPAGPKASQPKKKKSSKGQQKKKSTGDKKGGNPLEMDIPGFRL